MAYSLPAKKSTNEAYKMMDKYGYLDNIMIPMKTMMRTTEFVHKGEVMGDSWNHSDDEMSFLTYWVLHKYPFNDSLKKNMSGSPEIIGRSRNPKKTDFGTCSPMASAVTST